MQNLNSGAENAAKLKFKEREERADKPQSEDNKQRRIIVIGGGASGLMAAYSAASCGADVTVLEKNEKAGKKIYITGKGRCNVTNDVSARDFINSVITNPKFLLGALNRLTPSDTAEFFSRNGAPLKCERGGRMFPESDKASDITAALLSALTSAGAQIYYNYNVTGITQKNGAVNSVQANGKSFECDAVILATGGISYPSTGSTGDGFRFAEKLGHSVIGLRPALCGININQPFCKTLQGLSLKNVSLTASEKTGKKICSFFGEMLFTHFGISGPIVLSASSVIGSSGKASGSYFELDLKPALSEEILDARLIRDFTKFSSKNLSNALTELLPKNLIPVIIEKSGVSPDKKISVITKADRLSLINQIKNLRMDIKSLRPIEESIVTGGGINVKEINPATMQSKLVNNLYFCGEVIDVDAYTGGYNMQIAFSTGNLAGESAAEGAK